MIKKAILLAVGATFAMGAFAKGGGGGAEVLLTATDSAKWEVSAIKNSKAGLVVSPRGEIVFKYMPQTEGFAPSSAAFTVATLNNTIADASGSGAATEFMLEAVQADGYANSYAEPEKGFDVELRVGDVALSKDVAKPTVIKDSTTMTAFLGMLDGLAEGSTAFDSFNAIAMPRDDGGKPDAPTLMKDLPEGAYSGQATVMFKATWLG